MNQLAKLILLIMIIFTLYHFWNDISATWNTGNTFGEGLENMWVKPSWANFRASMLKQPNVGLRNAAGDTDTLSIGDKSPLSDILPKERYTFGNLTKGEGKTWDVGQSNYLFQDTYKLAAFPWKKFIVILLKDKPSWSDFRAKC